MPTETMQGEKNKTSPVEETETFLGSRWGNKILEITSEYIMQHCWRHRSREALRCCYTCVLCVIVCFISLKTPCDFCLHSLNSYGNLKARWKAKKAKHETSCVVCIRKCISRLYLFTNEFSRAKTLKRKC